MTAFHSASDAILIPARLTAGEAADQLARIRTLTATGRHPAIEFSNTQDCAFPSAVSLQLCLAVAAHHRAAGVEPVFGPEARRLLTAQKLCEA